MISYHNSVRYMNSLQLIYKLVCCINPQNLKIFRSNYIISSAHSLSASECPSLKESLSLSQIYMCCHWIGRGIRERAG